MMPPPPAPGDRGTRDFTKPKPFGLRLFLKYKTTVEFDKEGDEDGEDVTGIVMQIWAEGELTAVRKPLPDHN